MFNKIKTKIEFIRTHKILSLLVIILITWFIYSFHQLFYIKKNDGIYGLVTKEAWSNIQEDHMDAVLWRNRQADILDGINTSATTTLVPGTTDYIEANKK